MQLQKKKANKPIYIMSMILVSIIVIGLFVVFGLFHIRQVDVIGNEYYSADEIQKMVMSDSLSENSLYLTWKYSQPDAAENLTFLSAVDVTMINPYHVQIKVYEKSIVGYLMYSGSMVYFDKDGVVVEISQETREGIPAYSGIAISEPKISEKIPVEDEDFLDDIISEAQMIQEILCQNGIVPKEIHYDDKQQLILYFANNRVMLGDNSYMEEKLSNLQALMPQMEELSGTLHMENYTAGTTTITFKKGEKGEEELLMNVNQPEGTSEENTDEASTDADGEESTEESEKSGYSEGSGTFSTDASGNDTYTDASGNVTNNMEQMYLGDDGEIISDGYGYIDPYTGAYILN